ncbi:MAG: glutamine-hydrolyzing GMP synthase, partial [Anaerolineae bacterium]
MPPAAMHRDTIVVLDYGSQYSQLIVRRVRECSVYAEMLPWDAPAAEIDRLMPGGIILSGGPNSVYDRGAPYLTSHVLERGVPLLGICYGMQLLAHQLGGQVTPATHREYGLAQINVIDSYDPLLANTPVDQQVWMSHGDRIDALPAGFVPTARSGNTPNAAMRYAERQFYGLQFHPEVAHTEHGAKILRNFAVDICGCATDWTAGSIIRDSIDSIRASVGSGRVICGLSGGV